jgi:hypothetical protein
VPILFANDLAHPTSKLVAFPAVFPVELYVLHPLFNFIGGGLMDAILYTMGADIVPQAKMLVPNQMAMGANFHYL